MFLDRLRQRRRHRLIEPTGFEDARDHPRVHPRRRPRSDVGHDRRHLGDPDDAHRRLVSTNWICTFAWTTRALTVFILTVLALT